MNVSKYLQRKPNEEVLAVMRGSLIPLWSNIVLIFVWLVLPFFLLFPLFQMRLFGVVIFFLLIFSGLFYAFRFYVCWQETLLVVTDLRVVDIDRPGLFTRTVSEVRYDQIRDVSYTIKGLWPTLFHYGTLVISVKGSAINVEVYAIRHPESAHNLLNELRHVESI